MYKKLNNPITGEIAPLIKRVSDGATIPMDEQNVDYQEYLKWISDGNQPEPADE